MGKLREKLEVIVRTALLDSLARTEEGMNAVDQLEALFKREMEKTEKAYGNCHYCYGKGYATCRYGEEISPDFESDIRIVTQPKTHMVFCARCNRGKQLKEIIQHEQKEKLK